MCADMIFISGEGGKRLTGLDTHDDGEERRQWSYVPDRDRVNALGVLEPEMNTEMIDD